MDKHGKELVTPNVMNRVVNVVMSYAVQGYNYAHVRVPFGMVERFETPTQRLQFEEELTKRINEGFSPEVRIACGATSLHLHIGVYWDLENE